MRYFIPMFLRAFSAFFLCCLVFCSKGQKVRSFDLGQEAYRLEPVATYYGNGALKSKGFKAIPFDSLGNQKISFKRDSIYEEFFPNGIVKRRLYYRKDLFHGEYEEFHPNGVPAVIGFYHTGKKNGLWKEWYLDGQPKYEIIMSHGLPSGLEQTWFDSGQMESLIHYDQGKKNGPATFFFKNGNKRSEANYVNDAIQGVNTFYYENGSPKAVYTFKMKGESILEHFWDEDGSQTITNGSGVMKYFDKNRNVHIIETYNFGCKNGPSHHAYPNGTIKAQGEMLNNFEEGHWVYYNEDGSVKESVFYQKGLRVDNTPSNLQEQNIQD